MEILLWVEISGGGGILHWGDISGGGFYTGVRFPGDILHWGEISGGKSYSETFKGEILP